MQSFLYHKQVPCMYFCNLFTSYYAPGPMLKSLGIVFHPQCNYNKIYIIKYNKIKILDITDSVIYQI